MDKRTVYGYWSQDLDGYGDRFVCGRTVKCRNTAQCALLERCEEKVLVNPAALAEVEAKAARTDEAERDVRHILFLLKLACRDEESTMSCFPDHCHSCEISKWITKHELEAVKNPLAKAGEQRG